MIRYSLACTDGHRFESWFQSSAAYDDLAARGLLACAVCGRPEVEKSLMAPSVSTKKDKEATAPPAEAETSAKPLSRPAHPAEAALKELREKIEKEADYVGPRFAQEARSMHQGETDHRPIWGEVKPQEAKALYEEGVPVAPLPFTPRNKVN